MNMARNEPGLPQFRTEEARRLAETLRVALAKEHREQRENLQRKMSDMMKARDEQAYQERLQKMSREYGYKDQKMQQIVQVGDQNEVILRWWRQMAVIYDPNLHHSFINDIPIKIVKKFLIDRGVAASNEHCLSLFKVANVSSKQTSISRPDFHKIFTRFMFVNALVKVADFIDTGGRTNKPKDENDTSSEVPLVLKIS